MKVGIVSDIAEGVVCDVEKFQCLREGSPAVRLSDGAVVWRCVFHGGSSDPTCRIGWGVRPLTPDEIQVLEVLES